MDVEEDTGALVSVSLRVDKRPHHFSSPSEQQEDPKNAPTEDVPIALRPGRIKDVDEINSIVSCSFAFPWSREMIADELSGKPWSRTLVASLGKEVVGFALYWLVADELHLLNLAVHPERRRQGIARTLIKDLIDIMYAQRLSCILLEVRSSNEPAQNLYRGLGFKELALRRGYYANNEDGLVMCLRRSQ